MGNAYDNASLVLTPNGYSAGKMYSATPTDGSGDFTFIRAGIAMRRNSVGLWEEVAANVPRLQYPVGVGCPSWLNEPSSTNIFLRSNTPSFWSTNSGSTGSDNISTSPQGVVNAGRVIETAVSGLHFRGLANTPSVASVVAGSVSAKPAGRNWIFLSFFDGVDRGVFFNIQNGTIGSAFGGAIGFIELDSEGYYRCEIRATTTAAASFTIQTAIGDNNRTYLGDGVSGVDVWAMQVEQRATATSPIITAGSALTRLADSPTLTGASALIGQTEGTIFWSGSTINGVGSDLFFVGSLINCVALNITTSRQIRIGIRANNSLNVGTTSVGVLPNTSNFKVAIRYQSGNISVFANGTEIIASALTYTFSAAISEAEIARGFFDAKAVQNNNEFLILPVYTNAQLAALTTL
jgi:hypothetical protein